MLDQSTTISCKFLIILLIVFSTSAELPRVGVRNGRFYSKDDNRTLMFRGINSVIKHSPWYDGKLLEPERQAQLQEWGFNVVRLGMMWSGLEPFEGQINETYNQIIKDTVNSLSEHGIYSYLDMHQDVLTKVAEYWGIPEWVAAKMDPPEHPYPWPMKDKSGFSTWACGYFTQEISNAFQQLYTRDDLMDLFASFWLHVTERYMDNHAILGYELMNEPWTGDIYQDTSLLLPGNAGGKLLEPFFNRASDAIRSIDNETLIFWEPTTYAYIADLDPGLITEAVIDAYLKTHNISIFYPVLQKACGDLSEEIKIDILEDIDPLTIVSVEAANIEENKYAKNQKLDLSQPSLFGPGFTAPPGGPEYLDRTVLSWHYYCWAIGYGENNEDFDPVLRAACDTFLGPMAFRTVQDRAQELGGSATFLTEFGICEPNATLTNSTGYLECLTVLDLADEHLQSWSYWDTASGGVFWDNKGNPIPDKLKVFTRPYPPATAGIPLRLHFDIETRIFKYEFEPDLTITAPTVIYVPKIVYDEGFDVIANEGIAYEIIDEQFLEIRVNDLINDVALITINPK